MGRLVLVVLGFTAAGAAAGTIIRGLGTGTAIGGGMGVVGGLLVAQTTAAREKEMKAVAQAIGFTYRGNEPARDLPPLALTRSGSGNPGFSHFIQGERESALVSFCDSRIPINATPIVYRAAVLLQAPDLDLPHFVMHPRLGLGGLYDIKMRARIELPSVPDVNVDADDGDAARLFTPEVIAFLERDREWFVEGMGTWLIALRWVGTSVDRGATHVRILPVERVPAFIDQALEVLRLFRPRR